ncbi:MAG: hypothetical protein HZB46_16565 [Solirubrobacterales bacterium]|nr:hypothetical protein [Solirubrobacterales bacterium]
MSASPVAERRTFDPLTEAIRLAAAAVVVLAGLLAGGGASATAPPNEAAKLVPSTALVYLHVSTDGDRPATARAGDLAERFPSWPALRRSILRRLEAPGCRAATEAIRTADEAALVLFDIGAARTANSLVLVDTGKDQPRPQQRRCGALTAEYVGRFLAIGQPESLAVARRLQRGQGNALADSADYRKAMDTLPAARVADGYASADGIRRLLAPQGGLLGAAGTLVDQPALRSAGFSVTAQDDLAKLRIHSLLDEDVAKRTRTFPPFDPTLADVVPEGAMAYVGVANLGTALQRVLSAAGEGQDALQPLLGGLDASLLRLFRGESAVIITPNVPAPVLTLVARTEDEAAARRSLARLPAALRKVFKSAVRDGKVVVSTAQSGVDAVLDDDAPKLADTDAFSSVTGGKGDGKVTSLVFLDFNRLLRLGEQTGLYDSRAYVRVKDDLDKVRAVGAVSSGSSSESTAEISLLIP